MGSYGRYVLMPFILGGKMPFISIRLVEGTLGEGTPEKKAEIARRIVQAVHEVGGLDKDLVWLTFEDIPPREWYVGEKKVEQIWAEKGKK